ncbi:MAG: sensor domain-containing protein [Anaerolineales bacterium]|nr:sensor domain-containing protein [Anaerolineales bacterium]
MYPTIEAYLDALKTALAGADTALIQDAQADAFEHLSMVLEAKRATAPDLSVPDALAAIIEGYGTPEETASAYREIERRTSPTLKQPGKPQSLLGRVFGAYVDPRTWGALLFMFITFVTGIIYFTWAVTGLALSLGFSILIIGLPFAILFLLSVQGVSLLEGRMVEALLGVRMPRRPLFAQPGLGGLERLKALVADKHTWLSLLYMILQLPLGVAYFVLNVVLLSVSLAFILAPLGDLFIQNPNFTIQLFWLTNPIWVLILLPILGFLLLTLTMHLARSIGGWHGRYAKWMLVNQKPLSS